MKIVIAMSGGVDSSTAAGLLVEAGHEVIGLAMKTHDVENGEELSNRACCTPDDMRDARKIADILNIPFYVLNYSDLFKSKVILPFAKAYQEGKTPNPCVECNDKVKFDPLLERAKLLEADLLATGHYAQISHASDGNTYLYRGYDKHKDQSYFLYRLRSEQLKQLCFPIGHMTKDNVREHAKRLGLPIADKRESQEICFVGQKGYAHTVEKILGKNSIQGKFIDKKGYVLGYHKGIHHYTIGQRRGLGVASSAPYYVTHIDSKKGYIVLDHTAPKTKKVHIENTTWTSKPPKINSEVLVQERYKQQPVKAKVVSKKNNQMTLEYDTPTPSGAPGQAAVIYDHDKLIGGGAIISCENQVLPIIQS